MGQVALIALILMLSVNSAHAFDGQCGVFEMEAKILKADQQFVLTMNEGTSSQMTVNLESSPLLTPNHVGVVILAQFKIDEACGFRCRGRLLSVKGILDPFVEPKIYTMGLFTAIKPESCCRR